MDDRPLFPAGAAIRRVDSELVLLLGGPRALLMQLAHPMIARGVAEHSDFRHDPFTRLQRTLDASAAIVFGTEARATLGDTTNGTRGCSTARASSRAWSVTSSSPMVERT